MVQRKSVHKGISTLEFLAVPKIQTPLNGLTVSSDETLIWGVRTYVTVSYTHLTLPTSDLV